MPRLEVPDSLGPFECHHVDFTTKSGTNYRGLCPFCGEDTFYVNPKTLQWDCKSVNKCGGREGNVYTFLGQVAEAYAEDRSPRAESQIRKLAELRGLPFKIVRRNVHWDDTGNRWVIPVRNEKGTVVDIRRCNATRGGEPSKKILATTGMETGLFGLDRLARGDKSIPVYICAGDYDKIAMEAFLKLNRERGRAVGVPGEMTWKDDWTKALKGRHVVLCYDADDAGDKGAAKVGGCDGWPKPESRLKDGRLRQAAKSIRYVRWPEDTGDGFDINDLYQARGARRGWKRLQKLLGDEHRRTATDSPQKRRKPAADLPEIETFNGLVTEYGKWLRMGPDFISGLKVTLATAISVFMGGPPVWTFLVGSSGSGKTALLETLNRCDKVVYRSDISVRSLISGWTAGDDPSLIPELDGQCFILKDFTEVLESVESEQRQVFAKLRGAYDGRVVQNFGNAKFIDCESRFSMAAGVTPVIHGRSSMVPLGERFLKFRLQYSRDEARANVRAALEAMHREPIENSYIPELVAAFVARMEQTIEERKAGNRVYVMETPEWFHDKILSLVDLIAHFRTVVERDWKGNVSYRPEPEIPTRLGIQLKKLAWALCVVDGKTELDEAVYALVRRVALDTATGFGFEIASNLIGQNGQTAMDLSKRTGLPFDTIYQRLEDMAMLKLVKRSPGRGEKRWSLDSEINGLWRQSMYVGHQQKTRRGRRARGVG